MFQRVVRKFDLDHLSRFAQLCFWDVHVLQKLDKLLPVGEHHHLVVLLIDFDLEIRIDQHREFTGPDSVSHIDLQSSISLAWIDTKNLDQVLVAHIAKMVKLAQLNLR